VLERSDILGRFLVGVDEVFGEGADDAVATGIDIGDLVRVLAAGFDDAAGRGVDYGGNAAGLGVESVLGCHEISLSLLWI